MNRILKRWIIGICIGMCIPAIVYVVHNYIHRNDKYVGVAHMLGVDVDTWADVNRLYEKAAFQHKLASHEIDREQTWLAHGNREVRERALVGLRYCTDPSVRPRATALIRTRLDDGEPALRLKAITMLMRVNDPNLATDVGRMVKDPVDYVRIGAMDALGSTSTGSKIHLENVTSRLH